MSVKGLIELAMDQDSRMQRAREQGFDVDTVWYHGTAADIEVFFDFNKGNSTGADSTALGHFFTKQAAEASEYADLAAHNLYTRRVQNEIDLAEKNRDWGQVATLRKEWEEGAQMAIRGQNIVPTFSKGDFYEFDAQGKSFGDISNAFWDSYYKATKRNKDGIDVKNVIDRPGSQGMPTDHRLVFDPSNIRSTSAAFDPRYLNSSKLMGDGPSAADLQPDERLRNLLNNVKTIGAIAGKRGVEDISDCASVQILLQLDTDWWPEVTPDSAKEKVANVWWSARNAAAESENLAQNKGPDAQSPQTHSGISNETKMYAPSPG